MSLEKNGKIPANDNRQVPGANHLRLLRAIDEAVHDEARRASRMSLPASLLIEISKQLQQDGIDRSAARPLVDIEQLTNNEMELRRLVEFLSNEGRPNWAILVEGIIAQLKRLAGDA